MDYSAQIKLFATALRKKVEAAEQAGLAHRYLATYGLICGALYSLDRFQALGFGEKPDKELPKTPAADGEALDELKLILGCLEIGGDVATVAGERCGDPTTGLWQAGFYMTDAVCRLAAAYERLEKKHERKALGAECNSFKHGTPLGDPQSRKKRRGSQFKHKNDRSKPTPRQIASIDELEPFIQRLIDLL
ncbi:MAG: hypothetical protein ICCCNLDF_02997 [Planctomycetes bacterium]|nr:hypothetical protein [Planctomycetota bacterium]